MVSSIYPGSLLYCVYVYGFSRLQVNMIEFGELFRSYRMKAGLVSLSDFADAFALKGYCYEMSIFSHWQHGKRVPTRRIILVTIVTLFIERKAIESLSEANDFLDAAGHGYLTYSEQEQFKSIVSPEFFRVGSLRRGSSSSVDHN